MPRPIDADALKLPSELPVDPYDDPYFRGMYSGWNNAIRECKDLIDSAPTISPDEVRGVGTWLRKEKVRHNLDGDGDYRYECSACGHSDEHNENVHVPFCWYCGAKMEVTSDA